jgi:hypothetical protein
MDWKPLQIWNIVTPTCSNINLRPQGFGFIYFNTYLKHTERIVSTVLPVIEREMTDREGAHYPMLHVFQNNLSQIRQTQPH